MIEVEFIGDDVQPKRRKPSVRRQRELINAQGNVCLYCGNPFGTTIEYPDGRKTKLRLSWDHFAPYSEFQDSSDGNFVAACHVCNSIKSDLCFYDPGHVAEYVARRWHTLGIKIAKCIVRHRTMDIIAERIITNARLFSGALCLILCLLAGCGAGKRTLPRAGPDDGPLKLLIASCEVQEKQLVTCPLAPFKIGLFGYTQTLEDLAACQIGTDELVQLCAIDKAEIQGKVNHLEAELDKWFRNPWLMLTIGAVAGAVVTTGIILY
jgi:hypothetical protein